MDHRRNDDGCSVFVLKEYAIHVLKTPDATAIGHPVVLYLYRSVEAMLIRLPEGPFSHRLWPLPSAFMVVGVTARGTWRWRSCSGKYVTDAQCTPGTQRSTCGCAWPITCHPAYDVSSVWTRLRGHGEASAVEKNVETRRTRACHQSYVSRVRYHGPERSPNRATRPRFIDSTLS